MRTKYIIYLKICLKALKCYQGSEDMKGSRSQIKGKQEGKKKKKKTIAQQDNSSPQKKGKQEKLALH